MTSPLGTFNLSAPLSGSSGTIAIGDVLVEDANDFYVLSTTANRGTKRSSGVAMSAWGSATAGAVMMQGFGVIDSTLTNLGTGLAGWVRVSTLGVLERVVSPSGSDDVVGWCEVDGTLNAAFGFITAQMVAGGSSFITEILPDLVVGGDGTFNDAGMPDTLYVTAATSFQFALYGPDDAAKAGTIHTYYGAGPYIGSINVGQNGDNIMFRGSHTGAATTTSYGDGNGVFFFGSATTVPTTNPPATGILLYVQAGVLKYRDSAGTITTVSGGGASSGSSGQLQTSDGAGGFSAPANVTAGASYIGLGSGTQPSIGNIRFGGSAETTRLAYYDGSSNIKLVTSGDPGYGCFFGDTSAPSQVNSSSLVLYAASGSTLIYGAGVNQVAVTSSTIEANSPIVGKSSPFAVHGAATQAMADTNQTIPSSVYSRKLVKLTGANTAQRTATFPHPASEDASYSLFVWCKTTAFGCLISTGTGTTVGLAAAGGGPSHLIFTPAGVGSFI